MNYLKILDWLFFSLLRSNLLPELAIKTSVNVEIAVKEHCRVTKTAEVSSAESRGSKGDPSVTRHVISKEIV